MTVVKTQKLTRRDVLHRAADLIEEFGWCQHAPARDEDGFGCDPQEPYAVSFCLTGAVERAIYDLRGGWHYRKQGPPPEFPWMRHGRPGDPAGKKTPLDPKWNNAAERTKFEVVARLRELADRAA